MKLIVNADDFGYSQGINDAISDLIDDGQITSATLMANGLALDDAVAKALYRSHCSFGVHLNITEFRPLTDGQPFHDAGLLTDDGEFNGALWEINWRGKVSPYLERAVYREWSAQVTRLLDNGIRLSHFDSHHHSHSVPWLFPVLKQLQRTFRVRKVRNTLNIYDTTPPGRTKQWSKHAWTWALKNLYRTKTTDYFTPFEWFMRHKEQIEPHADTTVEVYVHPGQPFADEETKLLRSDWQTRVSNLSLINYNQL